MFASRRSIRRSAWAVVVAFVFSVLGTAPLGLHAHAIVAGESAALAAADAARTRQAAFSDRRLVMPQPSVASG